MNFRQVHLDFHTGPKLENIGSEFSKSQFQKALKLGHVNSITLFAKCCHGFSYYPTKIGIMHPNLSFDLLKEQIEAAHEIGVKTPIYISAGLDNETAYAQPSWLFRNKDESLAWAKDFETPGFYRVCMNSPYIDIFLAQIREVLENYDGDGLFLDVVGTFPCYCQNCIGLMKEKGLNPENDEDVYKLARETRNIYLTRVAGLVESIKPGHPVFHNGGSIPMGDYEYIDSNTHLELESLPTGGWGYDYFPMTAAYARTLGMEFSGMTGKFHQSWGEFGGFKHPNALKYEAALSVANGARVSVGDQLHPNGKMDIATYRLIGEAYSDIEQKEPWLTDTESVADIAVLSEEALFSKRFPYKEHPGRHSWKGNIGACRILLEGKYLFDVVDTAADLSKYKVLILTDTAVLDPDTEKYIRDFVDNGGKLLCSYHSGLTEDNRFAFDTGAEYLGDCIYRPSYLHPFYQMNGLYESAYVIYQPCCDIRLTGEPVAYRQNPFFNRTVEHFTSHAHAPNNPTEEFPSITMGKDGIYISYAIFTEYAEKGSLIAKETVCHVLDMLLGDTKSITTDLPAQGVVTLMNQKSENRLICHLLYASPVKRGTNTEVIEDILPVYNTRVSIRTGEKPERVYLAPQNTDIPYTYDCGSIEFIVPKIECHQMTVIEY